MEPHIVALDVDGTIVDYDDMMTDRVRNTIQKVADAGHHVVIATGRAVSGSHEVVNRLDIRNGFVVSSNGSVITRLSPELDEGWELFHVESFDPEPALRRMSEALPTAHFMVEDTELTRWATGEFPDGELQSITSMQLVSFEELTQKRATRIVMRDLNGTNEEFVAAVEKIGLHGVTYSVGWSNWLDIAPEGVSKASGLQVVADELGVDRVHTVGAGDGSNDHEMIQWVAHGVAMGQAKPELKEIANVVTGTVTEDGLAEALEDYFGV
ncbi:HAD family hydrolase [Brevibacterium daeguense]|uniref:HAD family hydrolase n=1 Tax=Brevibacterium daeguense TaxID=909936 RepID=A0ABP8EKI2_9MICO|nr:HAD family hydrolase [Brevibacterium daeguense]